MGERFRQGITPDSALQIDSALVTRPTFWKCSKWQDRAQKFNNDGTFLWQCITSHSRKKPPPLKLHLKKRTTTEKKKQERSAKEGNEKFSIIVSLEICTDN